MTSPPLTLPPPWGPEGVPEGPGQLIVPAILDLLKSVPEYVTIFNEDFYGEARTDLSTDMLPAILCFDGLEKKDPRLLRGNVELWIVAGVANRRDGGRLFLRAMVSSLYDLFDSASDLLDAVPASWEIGANIDADFTRAYANDNIPDGAPLVVLKISYAVHLEDWRRHLGGIRDPREEQDGTLTKIYGAIYGYDSVESVVEDPDLESPDVTVELETNPEGE